MAKKKAPGWKKHQERKELEKFGPPARPGFVSLSGEEARRGIEVLLDRMEKNPENFGGWGYFDSEGNEYEDSSFLNVSRETRKNQDD